MRLLVISDTHGKTKRVSEIYKKLKDIDVLVHLGDYKKDGQRLAEELGVDCFCIKGNMDGSVGRDYEFLYVECGKILLTHGHGDGVKRGMEGLLAACREEECVAAFFGHTHVPYLNEIEGITLLNPGSISQPREGNQGSYAIVTTDEKGLRASILYDTPGGPKKKPQGGYLRSLMNYSDGF